VQLDARAERGQRIRLRHGGRYRLVMTAELQRWPQLDAAGAAFEQPEHDHRRILIVG
jgi:hypothetical protein